MTNSGFLNLETAFYCFLVSFFWGASNPLIKRSTTGITQVKANNPVKKFISEITYLFANRKYVLLFCVNQLGSVLYFLLLQKVDLSIIVPSINALTFIITACVGCLTGEDAPSFKTFLGVFFILTGISFCVLDKV